MEDKPLILVLTGLPGTGKSSIGKRLTNSLTAPLFSGDAVMSALEPLADALDALTPSRYADVCDGILAMLAERQIAVNQNAVIDSVLRNETLESWAKRFSRDASLKVVECVVSDEDVHRARLAARADVTGEHTMSWDALKRLASALSPLTIDRLVIDTLEEPDVTVARIVEFVTLDR
jgi:predicted kinase